jgi:hypothetical protein
LTLLPPTLSILSQVLPDVPQEPAVYADPVTVAATWTSVPEASVLIFAPELAAFFRRLTPSQIDVAVEPVAGSEADASIDGVALVDGFDELLAAADGLADDPASEADGDDDADDPPHAARAIARIPMRMSLRCIRHLHAVMSPFVPLSG